MTRYALGRTFGATKDYYLEIQQKLADSRDNRGKRHELAFVVVLFLTSILETAYWVSNQTTDGQKLAELVEAARRHWAVEIHHHIRDVQMGEDKMVTRNAEEARVIAGFITTATNMLVSASQNQSISELRERLTRNQALVDPLFKRK